MTSFKDLKSFKHFKTSLESGSRAKEWVPRNSNFLNDKYQYFASIYQAWWCIDAAQQVSAADKITCS